MLTACALPAHAADCPTNYLKYNSTQTSQSNAATYDVALGVDFGLETYVGYDLVKGTLHEHSFAGLGANSWVRVTDLYDVTGVPPGTVVLASAELAVTNAWVATGGCGGTGCWGYVSARIVTAEGDSTEQSCGTNVYSPGQVNILPFAANIGVTFTAGTPLPLTFRLEGHQTAGGSHATEAEGSIRFLGLPPGVHVTSCQGFVDPSVPALPGSWGALKAAYR